MITLKDKLMARGFNIGSHCVEREVADDLTKHTTILDIGEDTITLEDDVTVLINSLDDLDAFCRHWQPIRKEREQAETEYEYPRIVNGIRFNTKEEYVAMINEIRRGYDRPPAEAPSADTDTEYPRVVDGTLYRTKEDYTRAMTDAFEEGMKAVDAPNNAASFEAAIKEDAKKGKKYDADKLRWDLLPLHLISGCVEVLTYGAAKYAPNNWQNVENGKERYFAALMRHIVAYRNGEKRDTESGVSHLAHAMCNLVFLDYLEDKDASI